MSRWRIRGYPYGPTGEQFGSPYSLLLHMQNLNDNIFNQQLQIELANSGEIARDFTANGPAFMKGNIGAYNLLHDYDATITLSHALMHNFEITEPFQDPNSIDWVGQGLIDTFGEGWAGPPDGNPLGRTFTHRSRREIFNRAMELAKVGYKTRVSVSCSLPPRSREISDRA